MSTQGPKVINMTLGSDQEFGEWDSEKDFGADFGADYGVDFGTDVGENFGVDVGKDFGADSGKRYRNKILEWRKAETKT
jgi:hypothetical protein